VGKHTVLLNANRTYGWVYDCNCLGVWQTGCQACLIYPRTAAHRLFVYYLQSAMPHNGAS